MAAFPPPLMKTILCLIAVGFTLPLCAHAEDEKAPPAAPSADLSSFKTADELWAHIEELQKEPKVQPKSQEELIAIVKEWFGNQKAGAEAFLKAYPKDPRRHASKLIELQAGMQLSQIPGADPASRKSSADVQKELDAILAAPDATDAVKGEAAFGKTLMLTENLDDEKPETLGAFLKASDEFLAKFGTHELAPQMRQAQFQAVSAFETPESDALLKKFSDDKDPQLAGAAKQALAQRETKKQLRSKPIELKFTTVDGKDFDLEKLRGKVVLVDFWASWCGPCISEMPNVVATYKKLHDKGFEIVGISLDEDKAAMEASMKKLGMTWPQYFDGKGWQNTISTSFGIKSIPAAWLIDKKGMLRETDLRGETLGAGVEKLLAE